MIARLRALPRTARLAIIGAMVVLTPIAGWIGYQLGRYLGSH